MSGQTGQMRIAQMYTPDRVQSDGGNVLRGKACHICKARKVKCDRGQNGGQCSNCTKQNVLCMPAEK